MNLMEKFNKLKKFPRHNILVTICTLFMIFAVSITMIGFVVPKDVILKVDGREVSVNTSRIYVEEFLAEQNVSLRPGDRISMPLDSVLRQNDEVVIERAKRFVLTVDGTTRNLYSCETILSDALADCGVVMNEYDEIFPALETPVSEGMKVNIARVCVSEEIRTESIARTTVMKPNYEARSNHSVILQEGEDGSEDVTYKVITRDGVEIAREAVSRTVTKEPVDRVIEKGVQGSKIVAVSAEELKVKEVIDGTATAYTARSGARTASGKVAAYGIIAVDPRVIPMGSKLYIEAVDGSWTYGYAIAGDTGGLIKGKKIDLFYNSYSECIQFGRRPARIYVLE
ncbi:MAG: G5 domain-containing protein [Clostridia bacterium]|nr:G5 domain-containing protein [Clostridia bacterium]